MIDDSRMMIDDYQAESGRPFGASGIVNRVSAIVSQ
jgi:hypothetical protein